ncbi:MAG: hypothetical protein ALAOOOJD_02840 [bacterium]|nr:hypothetical protein [bacterium]
MTEFKVEVVGGPRNGEVVYVAYDWEHPPILKIDPPLVLEAGQGLKLITTYNNWTTRTLRFGLLSQDEMMILFGYFYKPSTTAVDAKTDSKPPQSFTLEQNFPNPFSSSGTTTFAYSLPRASEVELTIYDISGKVLAVLLRASQSAGMHKIVWEARGVAAGMYFIKMRADDYQAMRKLVLIR